MYMNKYALKMCTTDFYYTVKISYAVNVNGFGVTVYRKISDSTTLQADNDL